MARPREKYWYALKVFYNRLEPFVKEFKAKRYDVFVPSFASLLFVKCPESYLTALKRENWDKFMFYKDTEGVRPGKISDHEMEVFMMAVSGGAGEFLGSDTENYMIGDKVRVTEGIYKGYEGYIRRIKHDRKLLVCLQGVAVVAFGNIDMECVEKI